MDSAVVARLLTFPARLVEGARDAMAAEIATGSPTGEWSAREVVAHLVAVERQAWQARLEKLASGPGEPHWLWTEPGPVLDPEAASLHGALLLFETERTNTLAQVAALDGAAWARTGVHSTFGRLDVAGLLWVAVRHDEEHLATLEARARVRR